MKTAILCLCLALIAAAPAPSGPPTPPAVPLPPGTAKPAPLTAKAVSTVRMTKKSAASPAVTNTNFVNKVTIIKFKTTKFDPALNKFNVIEVLQMSVPNPNRFRHNVSISTDMIRWKTLWAGTNTDPIIVYDFNRTNRSRLFYRFTVDGVK
jgi:hypothetical protein